MSTDVANVPANTEVAEIDLSDVQGTESELTELEAVVERGLDSFREVGMALAEISNRRLYKLVGYKTFEDYAREKWNLDRSFAYRQIKGANVVKALSAHFDTDSTPRNEAIARELSKIKDEDQMIQAWGEALTAARATGRNQPTAAEVSAVVTRYREAAAAGETEVDAAKAFTKAVKAVPRIFSRMEDVLSDLIDLPMRAVSEHVYRGEGIVVEDIDAALETFQTFVSEFHTDLEAYRAHLEAQKQEVAAREAAAAKKAPKPAKQEQTATA